MEKKLYRSTTNKMLCGVCGGIADYFNVDANFVRICALVLSGAAVLAYLYALIVIPEDSADKAK